MTQRDYRHETFLAVLRAAGGERERILALHPESAAVRARDGAPAHDLGAALWSELLEAEGQFKGTNLIHSATDRRTPAEYYLRRREIAILLPVLRGLAKCPPAWRAVSKLPKEEIQSRCADIGLHIITVAARSVSRGRFLAWINPLGSSLARRVAENILSSASDAPDSCRRACREAYEQLCETKAGLPLASAIGRRALAAFYQKLSEETRDALARASPRTNIFEILAQDPTLSFSAETDGNIIWKQIVSILHGEESRSAGAGAAQHG